MKGEQHYKDIDITLNTLLKKRQEIDQLKREICKKEGITLIEVPYWWDGLKSSLVTMIKQEVHLCNTLTLQRSDLPIVE